MPFSEVIFLPLRDSSASLPPELVLGRQVAFPAIPYIQQTSDIYRLPSLGWPSLLLFPLLRLVIVHEQATGIGQMLFILYGKDKNGIPKLKII